MTNVPQNIRDLWKEIYVLFDKNYLMPNTEAAWNQFWEQAMSIKLNHGNEDIPHLMDLLMVVGDMIGDRMKAENQPSNERQSTMEDMELF